MLNFLYPLIRPVLFAMDAEKTHDLMIALLKRLQGWHLLGLIRQPQLKAPVSVAGIEFPNRLGLAAGLDKNGECIDAFAAMGFGFIEVGTVTPRPQPGNEKPRLFRFPKQEAIINRFGFNNQGVDQLIENVKNSRFDGVLGINIGKNFDTPVEQATEDYLICLRKVYPFASYITVNISSPNTANLRKLQFGDALEALLRALNEEKQKLADKFQKRVPVFVKIAPDLSDEEIDAIAESLNKVGVDGVIATNTTFDRQGLESEAEAVQSGGMSGRLLFEKSTRVLQRLSEKLDPSIAVIGVGGVSDGPSAHAKLAAGADLVQLYSALIFKGPGLVQQINRYLARTLGRGA